ncbi:MAG: UDP-N-acetylmuramoyl-L-alanine--D-glutamate ligase [Spirochaetales bacterium]|nr:UDP-N-acetylmuramoyl-L-alanine--D-glutamate ligase [Spirochaetales bacterium]
MGLGLHGGGAATARFFASRGAKVVVTDLRNRDVLENSLTSLLDFNIEYILGEHRDEDFINADMVLKNPAVPPTSKYLKLCRNIETDISVFLRLNKRPILAVTGSKGKSTTTSAVFHALQSVYRDPRLGGNITISPLSFFEKKSVKEWNASNDPVVLELSSWQLADLAELKDPDGRSILRPEISVITNILKDHQDRYGGMESYILDKTNIYKNQSKEQYTICNFDQETGRRFARETAGKVLFFSASPLPEGVEGAWLKEKTGFLRFNGKNLKILPETLSLPGPHNRMNLLVAAAMLSIFGEDENQTAKALSGFTGIAHRLELVREKDGIRYFNDSAATIPDAVEAALASFTAPIFLITGGTDKDLDFTPLKGSFDKTAGVFLLDGTAREKFEKTMALEGMNPRGVYGSLKEAFDDAVKSALDEARKGKSPVVLLSPGCASFGMFLNEFDRGNQFRELVKAL